MNERIECLVNAIKMTHTHGNQPRPILPAINHEEINLKDVRENKTKTKKNDKLVVTSSSFSINYDKQTNKQTNKQASKPTNKQLAELT